MIDVVCMKYGEKYGPEYVNRLFRGVRRNLSLPHRFICLTDDDRHLDPEIYVLPARDFGGWWNKLWIFSGWTSNRQLALDVDDVVTGSLDELASYDGAHAMWSDPYQPARLAGAVHNLAPGVGGEIWEMFMDQADWIRENYRSDQEFYNDHLVPDRLDRLFPGQIVSYKAHCGAGLPPGARYVAFHGEPKPPGALSVGRPEDAWIKEHWR